MFIKTPGLHTFYSGSIKTGKEGLKGFDRGGGCWREVGEGKEGGAKGGFEGRGGESGEGQRRKRKGTVGIGWEEIYGILARDSFPS
jgi:hypothetical protein